ncbi:MAG: type II toxin-antitoxin system RelE/ParE family toxin [Candidatus Vogelbacteria bacterium]|nr:type II toxin-antitoxin system RelE/ParE family toxin [Candidatus Vogelbacteria bacterium]
MRNSGGEPFLIRYHQRVITEDIISIPRNLLLTIQRAIETRLATAPDFYGQPLRKPLSGLSKLRVSDYRVIFQIRANIVHVLIIGHRKDVYEQLLSRI